MTLPLDELPEGWANAVIPDLVSLDGLFTDGDWVESKDQDQNGGVRLIQLADIGDGVYRDRSSRFLTMHSAKELGCTFLKPGDLLISRMADPIGRACIYPGDEKPAATVVDACIVRVGKSGVDSQWLMNAVNSPTYRRILDLLASGTTRRRISRANLGTASLPLPPLAEQRRIVTKLEALQARSRRAREALAEVPAMLEQLRHAVLVAAFRGNLTADWRDQHPNLEPASVILDRIRQEHRQQWEQAEFAKYQAKAQQPPKNWRDDYVEPEPVDDSELPELPDGWSWATLDELVHVQLGQRRAPEFAKLKKYPYIRSANITWQGLDLSDVKTMGFANPDSLQIQAGDVLLNEASGSPTEVGKPALWRGEIPNCCFQATVLRLRSRTPALRPEWLFYNCLRDAILGEYAAKTPGIGIIHLTAKLLRTWPIPLAPIEEQNEVVARLETAIKVIHTLEESVAKSLAELNDLDQSILAKAFRGELVPQDPNDEPASVLLDRIRAEREQATESPTKSNGRAPRRQKRKTT